MDLTAAAAEAGGRAVEVERLARVNATRVLAQVRFCRHRF
jgi:hypothetical protein